MGNGKLASSNDSSNILVIYFILYYT